MDNPESPNPFFRVDLLTGCNNLVSFSDALANDFDNISLEPLSMIAVDVHQLSKINETRGRATVLRRTTRPSTSSRSIPI